MVKINERIWVSSFMVSKVLNDRFGLIIQTLYSGWRLPVWRNFLTILNTLCYALALAYGVTFEVRLIHLVQICIQTTEIRFSLYFLHWPKLYFLTSIIVLTQKHLLCYPAIWSNFHGSLHVLHLLFPYKCQSFLMAPNAIFSASLISFLLLAVVFEVELQN